MELRKRRIGNPELAKSKYRLGDWGGLTYGRRSKIIITAESMGFRGRASAIRKSGNRGLEGPSL